MGADEMRTITSDRWDDEVWGAAHPSKHGIARPKLFFYFAQKDHWITDQTRDDLMRVRGPREGEEWRPVMEMDDHGIPHGFCICEYTRFDTSENGITFPKNRYANCKVVAHSLPVAEKVKEYILEVISHGVDSHEHK